MGAASRRKALGIAPEPDQPIPAERLRALYPELLEIQLADANLKIQTRHLQDRTGGFNAKVQALAPGADLTGWSLDFKSGRMVQAIKAAKEAETKEG